jgi:hypothetical protein
MGKANVAQWVCVCAILGCVATGSVWAANRLAGRAMPTRPATFIANHGQFGDPSLWFAALDREMNVLLRRDSILFQPKVGPGESAPFVLARFPRAKAVAPQGLGGSAAYHCDNNQILRLFST